MTEIVDRIAHVARERGLTIAVAESLTSGLLASEVGKGAGAESWFAGGVVAYMTSVKERVLGLAEGTDPCSAECARTIARGARELLGADIAVSTTGVGGPDAEDGHPPGTVYIGWATTSETGTRHGRFSGGPGDVLGATVDEALRVLLDLVDP